MDHRPQEQKERHYIYMRKAPPNAASIPNGKKTAPLIVVKEIKWVNPGFDGDHLCRRA